MTIDTTSDIFIHFNYPNENPSVKHYTMVPSPAYQLSDASPDLVKFRSEIHPKGIDPIDVKRAKNHIKRIEYKNYLQEIDGRKFYSYVVNESEKVKIPSEHLPKLKVDTFLEVLDIKHSVINHGEYGVKYATKKYYYPIVNNQNKAIIEHNMKINGIESTNYYHLEQEIELGSLGIRIRPKTRDNYKLIDKWAPFLEKDVRIVIVETDQLQDSRVFEYYKAKLGLFLENVQELNNLIVAF